MLKKFTTTSNGWTGAGSIFTKLVPGIAMSSVQTDALVIGCGVAGASAALKMADMGMQVTLLTSASEREECNSYWAQGGIIYKGKDDPPHLLVDDIHAAGAGISYDPAVQKLVRDGPTRVDELLLNVANVPFERCASTNELLLTLEASHSRARIVYKADHTGRVITTSLLEAVGRNKNINLQENQTALDVMMDQDGKCCGAYVMDNVTKEIKNIQTNVTVLATGGLGSIYLNTSNPMGAQGHGIAMARRAGAKLSNMQYVQFHPTTLYMPNESRFLLTEALRGEGGILLNSAGTPFAKNYHRLGELAPRDVVARMILSEIERENAISNEQVNCMYLDISHKDSAWLQKRFPTIYKHCIDRGIDLTTGPMPVTPAAHYHCGGVQVDLHGKTSIEGLFAAGEVSCTGLHGGNRLASTSLLEGLVWGSSVADFVHQSGIHKAAVSSPAVEPMYSDSQQYASAEQIEYYWQQLRSLMWNKVGPVRTLSAMESAVVELRSLEIKVSKLYRTSKLSPDVAALYNAVQTAKLVAEAASEDSSSVGTHFVLEENEEPLNMTG